MSPKSSNPKASAGRVVKDIRRGTRCHFSAEDKIGIRRTDKQCALRNLAAETGEFARVFQEFDDLVLEGLRGDDSIAELCRKEGMAQSLYTHGRRSLWRLAGAGLPVTLRVLRPARR